MKAGKEGVGTSNDSMMKAIAKSKACEPDLIAEGINPIKVSHSTRRDMIPVYNPLITAPLITHEPNATSTHCR